jgi:hypothetical protein
MNHSTVLNVFLNATGRFVEVLSLFDFLKDLVETCSNCAGVETGFLLEVDYLKVRLVLVLISCSLLDASIKRNSGKAEEIARVHEQHQPGNYSLSIPGCGHGHSGSRYVLLQFRTLHLTHREWLGFLSFMVFF